MPVAFAVKFGTIKPSQIPNIMAQSALTLKTMVLPTCRFWRPTVTPFQSPAPSTSSKFFSKLVVFVFLKFETSCELPELDN